MRFITCCKFRFWPRCRSAPKRLHNVARSGGVRMSMRHSWFHTPRWIDEDQSTLSGKDDVAATIEDSRTPPVGKSDSGTRTDKNDRTRYSNMRDHLDWTPRIIESDSPHVQTRRR